ncbi:hypothetical protein AYL99_05414 [Fonsecaea erecta]|uniref:Uncharacterized protein n=1 Tax=Fonsecaea erecta TaxID=1367422 RepID=A0A178ZL70_9EURO|nr:hypothetical protein AYL99_05414 [Fonsecaea erecta]OAP60412.1 hypothetical protein AYL99_05414 [Fonsecaea erecta]
MPQKSPFSISIPPTDLLTYLFPPDEKPSTQPLYISADDPSRYSLSPAETLVWVKQLALGLQRILGVNGKSAESRTGFTIMMFTPNHVLVPVVYLAAIAAGGIFSGCSISFGVNGEQYPSSSPCLGPAKDDVCSTEATTQLQNTGTEVFFVHPKLLKVALAAAKKAGLPKSRIFLFDQEPHPETEGIPDFRSMLTTVDEAQRWQWKRLNGDEARNTTAVLNYSSGTTGLPKGVRISHTNLIANVSQSIYMRDLEQPYTPSTRPQERWLGFLPLSHAYGQLWTILAALKTQSPVYIMAQFHYVEFLKHIQTHKITHLQTAPPVLVMLAKRPETESYDISSLRNILSGAAPLSQELQNEVTSKLNGGRVVQTWGMTEVTCSALHMPGGRDDRSGSVGYIDPNCEMKLLDDSGVEVPIGERGEIHVRGPNICQGYWRNKQATRDLFDQDGFLRTGDIAVRNAEGLYWIVDRKKELIKVKGLQVAPAELEAALLEHDGVADAAVVGIKLGQDGDEAPRAYVVLKEKVKGSLTADALAQWLHGRVAKHKYLTGGVVFIDEVPKSPSGKIQRKLIREWAAKDSATVKAKLSRLSRVYVSSLQDRIRLLESTVQQLGQQGPVVTTANNSNDLEPPPPPGVDEEVSYSPPLDLNREISSGLSTGGMGSLALEGPGAGRLSNVGLQPEDDSLPLPQEAAHEEGDNQLEEAYWSGQNAVLPLVVKSLFVADRIARRSQYFSRALRACMIAVAARGSTMIDSSRQRQLRLTACQMVRVEDHQNTGLAGVQSLLLLADLACAVGNSAQARALHLKAGEKLDRILGASMTLSEMTSTLAREAIWRTVIFYTVTSQFWHVFDSSGSSAPPGQQKYIEKFLSKKSPSQQGPHDLDSSPTRSICSVWTELMRMSTAAMALEQSSPSSTDNTIDLESLARLDAECHDWYCRLPWSLRCPPRSRPAPPAEFLVLLICYHCTLILLHRKQVNYHTTAASVGEASFSPTKALSSISRMVCLKNAIRLSDVFSQYRQHYQVSHLGIRAVLPLTVASATLAAEIADGEDGTGWQSQKEHLAGLLDAFRELSETVKVAERPAGILSRHVNPSTVAAAGSDSAPPTRDLLDDLVASFAGMNDLEQGAQVP